MADLTRTVTDSVGLTDAGSHQRYGPEALGLTDSVTYSPRKAVLTSTLGLTDALEVGGVFSHVRTVSDRVGIEDVIQRIEDKRVDRFRFVDDAGALRLDLNNHESGWYVSRGLDLGGRQIRKTWISQPGYDGATLASSDYEVSPMRVPLLMARQTSARGVNHLFALLEKELTRDENTIQIRPDGLDGVIGQVSLSGTTVTANSPYFLSTDVGRQMNIPGVGVRTVTAFISAIQVTVNTSGSASNQTATWVDQDCFYIDTYRAEIVSPFHGQVSPSPWRLLEAGVPVELQIERAPHSRGAGSYI